MGKGNSIEKGLLKEIKSEIGRRKVLEGRVWWDILPPIAEGHRQQPPDGYRVCLSALA